jgi:hypothetical protein
LRTNLQFFGRARQVFAADRFDRVNRKPQPAGHPGHDLQGHQQAQPAMNLAQDGLHSEVTAACQPEALWRPGRAGSPVQH